MQMNKDIKDYLKIGLLLGTVFIIIFIGIVFELVKFMAYLKYLLN